MMEILRGLSSNDIYNVFIPIFVSFWFAGAITCVFFVGLEKSINFLFDVLRRVFKKG